MPKVKIDDLAITIARELDKYDRSVTDAVKKAVRETATDTRTLLNRHHRTEAASMPKDGL